MIQILQNQPNILEVNSRMKMIGRVLIISVLYMLGSYAQRENFIIEGNENFVESEVQFNEFKFGSNWQGPAQSTVCIDFTHDENATSQFGEPEVSFRFFPPGETTPIPLLFNLVPEDFFAVPFVFTAIVNDSRICANITKREPIYQICIQGDSSCNGGYEYEVAIGSYYDTARSNINFLSAPQPPSCRVASTCAELNLEYEYVCNKTTSKPQCLEILKRGPTRIVPNSVCDDLNLQRARCDVCNWIVGPWGSCNCNRGRRLRQVICDCEGRRNRDSQCKHFSPKPNRVERCELSADICGVIL